jgi:hypothetical protein
LLFCVRLRRSLTNNAKALLFKKFAFSGQKREKTKNLKWSVWEAQAKGISYTLFDNPLESFF